MAASFIVDDSQQQALILLSSDDPNEFKSRVIQLLNEHPDKFDIFHLHQNDESTTISKESFLERFESALLPDLLSAIFDAIDEDQSGTITNTAFHSFTNQRHKHPAHEPTQIVECRLYTVYPF